MIFIIDYGIVNIRSIQYKLERIGIKSAITSDPKDIEQAEMLILPGVGHFAKGMENLEKMKLIPVLNKKVIQEKTPIMGICLGLQLFTKRSEEGNAEGLGWIDAETVRFKFDEHTCKPRIPHVGWNTIKPQKESPLLTGVADDQRFYFTHSYYVQCHHPDEVLATTNYGYEFTSIIHKENIWGTQFHPEKSHKRGIELVKNFVRYFRC